MSDPAAITGLHFVSSIRIPFVSSIQIPANVKYICSETLSGKYIKI